MRASEIWRWVWREVRLSRVTSIFIILGVVLNVVLIVFFLAFATGVEVTAIQNITANMPLFTLSVQHPNSRSMLEAEFTGWESDRRVIQTVPVLNEFAAIRPRAAPLPALEQELRIYTGNVAFTGPDGQDLRITSVDFEKGHGQMPTPTDRAAIVVSMPVFNQLAEQLPGLTNDNVAKYTFELVTRRGDGGEEQGVFPVRIIGITKTTQYENALVYITPDVAEAMDNWRNGVKRLPARAYDQFDFVVDNLEDLQSLREDFVDAGYQTSSVLDRIDKVRNVLFLINIGGFSAIGVSSLVAGSNLVSTLSAQVLRRQHDIGVLKAVGATDQQVRQLFIWHAIYFGVVGCVIGIGLAVGGIRLTEAIFLRSDSLDGLAIFLIEPQALLLIAVSTVIASAVAAFVPAQKAAAITPIDTLRGG